jgi:hypothetical protein
LLQKEFEGAKKEELRAIDTLSRIQEHFNDLYAEIQRFDKESKFIS